MGKSVLVVNRAAKPAFTDEGTPSRAKYVLIETLKRKVLKTNCSFEFVLCAIGAFVSVYIERFVGRKENRTKFSGFPENFNRDSFR